jgi:glycosyltransferase involved in cell wall biosynthesis
MTKKKTDKTISACLILKNEGSTIYRCLDSIKDIVDEYIIGIDESTSDNTYEEVYKFFRDNKMRNECGEWLTDKVKVYDFKWKNDFSKTRNDGMDKATGDYILIMDGHEYFPDTWWNITQNQVTPVRSLLKKVKDKINHEEIDEAYFQLYQQPFLGMTPNNFFLQPRIYRNDPKIRFNRPAHNTITSTDPNKSIHFVDIILIHDAPEDNRSERKKQRTVMNIERIEADIKRKPKDTRNYFYLGNTLIEKKEYKKALSAYKKYLKYRIDDTHEKYQVYMHMGICYRGLKEFQKCRDSLMLAKGIDILRRDAYSMLGSLYLENKMYNECVFELTTMLNLRPQASRMFQNGGTQTWDPHQKLAIAYENLGNIPKAVAHLEQAYKLLPNENWLETIHKWRDTKSNILIIDAQGSFTKDLFEYFKGKKEYNVVFSPRYDLRLCKWADYIWCEWADENAILCSKKFADKTVIRLHGYEAYLLKHIFNQIEWNKVKKVVFVAEHIKDMMLKNAKINKDKCVVIHNGVNVDKFYIKKWERDKMNIGYAGFVNDKKNPYLLLQTIKANPQIKFHLRVDFQDPFWKATFEHELKDCGNVTYHGRYNNLADFWNKMNGVLCTSIIESFSFNVAEAMACGCVPFVYNFNGADEFWKKWIYTDVPKLKAKLNAHDKESMKSFRQYIIDNYNYKDRMKDMEKILLEEIKQEENVA